MTNGNKKVNIIVLGVKIINDNRARQCTLRIHILQNSLFCLFSDPISIGIKQTTNRQEMSSDENENDLRLYFTTASMQILVPEYFKDYKHQNNKHFSSFFVLRS